MTCKLWVQDNWTRTAVRADQIVTIRVVPAAASSATSSIRWQVEVVTRCPAAGDGGTTVALCRGSHEDIEMDLLSVLVELIATHLDTPNGGVINCVDELIARDMVEDDDVIPARVIEKMFELTQYA
ncbi:hypothetical protein GCM10010174_88720 [Kutzneria viridogrisea]|uniref:Uncharacterized protein n=1 Tax=Kutzneria viridogrisea TaxID=47990 RepID=A0ABR6BIV1_9PSEU|nr:hypothetical protein [Kutzneria viridogrisea]